MRQFKERIFWNGTIAQSKSSCSIFFVVDEDADGAGAPLLGPGPWSSSSLSSFMAFNKESKSPENMPPGLARTGGGIPK